MISTSRLSWLCSAINTLEVRHPEGEIAQVRGDPRLHRIEVLNHGIGDIHLVAGKRENLRNAVPHQARANNGDTCFRHRQPAV